MRLIIIILVVLFPAYPRSQELQLHYDFRHSVDPKLNSRNFPLVVFKYIKDIDTLGSGSFLFEAQAFFNGEKGYMGQAFLQASQSLRFWKPKVYLQLNFSGGLGVAPPSYGYYISNSYGIGLSMPLVFKRSWYSFSLMYRYSDLKNPSHDIQSNTYIGGGLFNYRLMYACSMVAWVTDRDDGLPENAGKTGKKIAFFADPQAWYGIGKGFSLGTRLSLYYHVISNDGRVQVYPTLGVKRNFDR